MRTRMTDWLTGTDEASLALPPYLAPFAKAASGSDSDDDSDDGDDDSDDDDSDDDDDDSDDDDDELAGLSDDELREKLRAVTASLTKANGQSARKRRQLRETQAELEKARAAKAKKPADKKDDDAPDIDAIREEAKREAKTEADNRIKRSEAKAALVAAGVSRDVAADLIGFVKFDDLDVEGDEVEGLDEEIERIKKKYPTFFVKARRRRESVAGDGDRDGRAPRKKPMTASEKQAARLAG